MKQTFLLIIFISLGFSTVFAQIDFEDIKINELFRLEVDSFEIRRINDKGHQFTNYFLHYTVTNISDDTLIYFTNSCPSYNQYNFEINDTIYNPNIWVACPLNLVSFHELSSGQFFSETEIMDEDFSSLKLGIITLKLTIPVDVRSPKRFQVDGHRCSDNLEELVFNGEILIVENEVIILSKREEKKLKQTSRKN